jgi:hypothetical protein
MRFGALLFELAGKLAHPVPSFPGDSDDENTILNFGGSYDEEQNWLVRGLG